MVVILCPFTFPFWKNILLRQNLMKFGIDVFTLGFTLQVGDMNGDGDLDDFIMKLLWSTHLV